MRYRKGGTRQKNAHAARRNVCAIVRAVYVLCTFCFLPLVLLVLRNSLICSHACFTLTFCSFTFCFIPRIGVYHGIVRSVIKVDSYDWTFYDEEKKVRFNKERCCFHGTLIADSPYLNKDVSDYPFGSGGAIRYIP